MVGEVAQLKARLKERDRGFDDGLVDVQNVIDQPRRSTVRPWDRLSEQGLEGFGFEAPSTDELDIAHPLWAFNDVSLP